MADAVTSRTILDGRRNVVMLFTDVSDGVGEAAVLKVDVSTLQGGPSEVVIDRIEYDGTGLGVDILWDATTDVLAYSIPTNLNGAVDFSGFGGLSNNAGAGKTGDIMFSTVGATAADRYSIVLYMHKKYA